MDKFAEFLADYTPVEEREQTKIASGLAHMSDQQLAKLASPLIKQAEEVSGFPSTRSGRLKQELQEKMRNKQASVSPTALAAAESLNRSIKLARQYPSEMADVTIKTAASTLNNAMEKAAIGKGTAALLGALGGGAVAGGLGLGAYKHSQGKNFRAGVLKTPSGYKAIAGPSSKIKALKQAIKNRDIKAFRAASRGVTHLHPGYTYKANVAAAMRRLKNKKKSK